MNLDLVNSLFNDVKKHKFIQNFIKELQTSFDNSKNEKKEDLTLLNSNFNENKLITKFRDKMFIERNKILNNYAEKTSNFGEMYYIYGKNSKMENGYNLCICIEGESHTVIEEDSINLPSNAKIGSVLRKADGIYELDENATNVIAQEISSMTNRLFEEQTLFLNSQRIEGHIYEMAESNGDRALLFDITNNSYEGFEEIDFPIELLNDSKEGDLFLFKNNKYEKK